MIQRPSGSRHARSRRAPGRPKFISIDGQSWQEFVREDDPSIAGTPYAAKLFSLGSATLYRKVEEYGIERK
jgi:hypothetical protein